MIDKDVLAEFVNLAVKRDDLQFFMELVDIYIQESYGDEDKEELKACINGICEILMDETIYITDMFTGKKSLVYKGRYDV